MSRRGSRKGKPPGRKKQRGNFFDHVPEAFERLQEGFDEKKRGGNRRRGKVEKRQKALTEKQKIRSCSGKVKHQVKHTHKARKNANWQPVESGDRQDSTLTSVPSQGPVGYYGVVSGEKEEEGGSVQQAEEESKSRSHKRRPQQGKAYVVVGFDLGTSCTKVILQAPYMRRAWAVPFQKGRYSVDTYLQPTMVYVTQDGRVHLRPSEGSHQCGDLKLLLLTEPDKVLYRDQEAGLEIHLKELTACYLGLVLRKARKWFEATQRDLFADQEIVWQFNLGMPAKNYDDESLKPIFLRLARVGWYLSELPGAITLDAVRKAWEISHPRRFDPGIDPEEDIQVVPEVVAEVVGYARSSLRDEGLHLLVDIGAGTMDLSTFILHALEGEDRYEFMAADVQQLGCFNLHQSRLKKLLRAFEDLVKKKGEIGDLAAPIPETLGEYLPASLELNERLEEGFRSGSEAYRDQCVSAVAQIVKYTRQRRDPNSSVWKTKLPIFICGGGNKMDFYQEVMEKAKERLRNFIPEWSGFEVRELPRPDRLEADELGPDDYHRMAVAYGLSYPKDQIGEIVPPSDIEDLEKEEIFRETLPAPTSKDLV